ncbi:aldehyde dehydrogenase family protein [uncultured Marinococcus sp.]|uniref:aldehyde dehydrogenase family protein n=1 Tax=uncultured Marinococcus sp. TaxID=487012 RepID=UPI00260C1B63|nr:aldehyde dehydrogenase family protein [uncultured Marinococcus sp.]
MLQGHSVVNDQIKKDGETIQITNPSNIEELVGEVTLSDQKVVNQAAEAAKQAQKEWVSKTGAEKSAVLYKAAQLINQYADELATLATKEMGKPIKEMKGEVQRAIQLFRYYAAEGVRPDGDTIPASAPGVHQYAKRVPLGVVAIITPWNFPVAIPVWKIAPALVCGNAVVWKPAENAYLTASKMTEILNEAGFPSGLINLVLGRGREIGNYIVEQANINAVSFTGSTKVGKAIGQTCAQRNIKFQTEMGGKNPAIVMADADLSQAAHAVLSGAFRSAGQKCTATSLVIVEDAAYESFKQELATAMKDVQVTPADQEHCYLGPVVSKAQYDKVSRYIAQSTEDGTVVSQGDIPDANGYYVRPTIVEGLDETHPAWNEEVFGPLIVLRKAKDINEAIDVCNNTDYGLSASIFTQNLNQSFSFLDRLEAGMVRVNLETAGVEYQAPFGGMKDSSSHTREQGQAALQFYSETKTCAIKYQ